MDGFPVPLAAPGQLARTVEELERCNEVSGHYGLVLSRRQMQNLAVRRFQALADTGRVEFGEGVLKKLVFAFCSSPYLAPADYESTLAQLQDLFYHFKNESGEGLSDDELIEAMRAAFDGPAHGSLEYLAGTALESLCRAVRSRGLEEEPMEEDLDDDAE